MKPECEVLDVVAFGCASHIEKFKHALDDETAGCSTWLSKISCVRPIRFRWVLSVGFGLVQGLAHAQTHDKSSSTFEPTTVYSQISQVTTLSDWLLSRPALDGAYPLGLVWTTPEAKAQQQNQQSAWLSQLERLRTEGQIGADV